MQISNVLAGYSDPATMAKQGEAGEAAGARGLKAAEGHASPATGKAKAMAEILSRYDVTDISPAEFSRMIQRLFEAGTLSEQELQQLAAIRMDLDLDGVEVDESIDLLDFYAQKIEKLQRRLSDADTPGAGNQQLAPLLHRLDWLEKFALIQSTPDSIGLDAVA
jgi:acyl-CoA reductase-like NAD-dependent aldehyde dehydrogenase